MFSNCIPPCYLCCYERIYGQVPTTNNLNNNKKHSLTNNHLYNDNLAYVNIINNYQSYALRPQLIKQSIAVKQRNRNYVKKKLTIRQLCNNCYRPK